MGNKYIYPTEKFNVKLDLEIDVKYVGVWDGMGWVTSFFRTNIMRC